MPPKGVKRSFDAIAAVPAAQVITTTWEDLPGLSEAGKAVLREAGLVPATALRLAEEFGFAGPDDLEVCVRACPTCPSGWRAAAAHPTMHTALCSP